MKISIWSTSILLGSVGILPALFGTLPDRFVARSTKSRPQHADGSGQNAHAPQFTVPTSNCRS